LYNKNKENSLTGQVCASRRTFLAGILCAPSFGAPAFGKGLAGRQKLLPQPFASAEKKRAIAGARTWLAATPQGVTEFPAPRSPGDKHAYYSEGDYWWPDPANPTGPYIRRDGISNPNKFDSHRLALIRLSRIVPALTAGWIASGDKRFAKAAKAHLLFWFVNAETRMAPHLNHAQAIIGVNTGRGTGIIDTLHLVEVALAAQKLLAAHGIFNAQEADALRTWFKDYLHWMRTSPNGLDEGDEINNHGSNYILQVAAFADIAEARHELTWCRTRFRELIDAQIKADGRQPLELARTKPFGYCLFNLDVLSACAHLLSTKTENLWRYRNGSGGSLELALSYMAPFIADKSRWPHAQDVEYWQDWPVRHPSLLFGAYALDRPDYMMLWTTLNADPTVPEVIRNFPVRQPLLWL
jgi:hypothetical protein